jgi:hydroxypyruvate isomerase
VIKNSVLDSLDFSSISSIFSIQTPNFLEARVKQSFSWWCYNGRVELEEMLRAAKTIGLSAIELIDPAFYPTVKKHGLEIASHRGHDSIVSGLNDRANHDRIERELLESIRIAEQWSCPNVIVFAGTRVAGVSEETAAQITAEGLARVAPMAESAGVNLILELLNSKVDHVGYQADHTAWGVKVCEIVASPRVKLLYDIYHMQITEGDVIRTIRENHAHIAHYHTAGNPGRNNLDDMQELNYAAIAKAISSTGFDGYIGHEFVPVGDPILALEQAFEIFEV